jgi:hypothetical protein
MSGSLRVSRLRSGRLWSNMRLLRRFRQVHDRGGLSSSGARGGYMKGCAPEGDSRPWFIIIILEPVF